jgi:hypothetical protein
VYRDQRPILDPRLAGMVDVVAEPADLALMRARGKIHA